MPYPPHSSPIQTLVFFPGCVCCHRSTFHTHIHNPHFNPVLISRPWREPLLWLRVGGASSAIALLASDDPLWGSPKSILISFQRQKLRGEKSLCKVTTSKWMKEDRSPGPLISSYQKLSPSAPGWPLLFRHETPP